MRLLLDVHHSRVAAERLRQDGCDVLAAADDSRMRVMADDDLLRAATADQRALVTENIKDFDRIIRAWASTGEHHAGVLFTSPRRFHRGNLAYPENLVVALRQFLSDFSPEDADWVYWLT